MFQNTDEAISVLKALPNFLPQTVIGYLDQYEGLGQSPEVLAEVLIRLKPFINTKQSSYFTGGYDKTNEKLVGLLRLFIDQCSIEKVEHNTYWASQIASSPWFMEKQDIAFIDRHVAHDCLRNIIDNTSNVVVIEDITDEKYDIITDYKVNSTISFYRSLDINFPDIIVMYRNLEQ